MDLCLSCANEYKREKHSKDKVPLMDSGKVLVRLYKRKRSSWERKIEEKEREILLERGLYLENNPEAPMIQCPECIVEPKLWPKVQQLIPGIEDRLYLCRICFNRRKRKAAAKRRIARKSSNEGEG